MTILAQPLRSKDSGEGNGPDTQDPSKEDLRGSNKGYTGKKNPEEAQRIASRISRNPLSYEGTLEQLTKLLLVDPTHTEELKRLLSSTEMEKISYRKIAGTIDSQLRQGTSSRQVGEFVKEAVLALSSPTSPARFIMAARMAARMNLNETASILLKHAAITNFELTADFEFKERIWDEINAQQEGIATAEDKRILDAAKPIDSTIPQPKESVREKEHLLSEKLREVCELAIRIGIDEEPKRPLQHPRLEQAKQDYNDNPNDPAQSLKYIEALIRANQLGVALLVAKQSDSLASIDNSDELRNSLKLAEERIDLQSKLLTTTEEDARERLLNDKERLEPKILRAALDTDPNNIDIALRLATWKFDRGDFSDAIEVIQPFTRGGENVEALLIFGESLVELGYGKETEAFCDRVLKNSDIELSSENRASFQYFKAWGLYIEAERKPSLRKIEKAEDAIEVVVLNGFDFFEASQLRQRIYSLRVQEEGNGT